MQNVKKIKLWSFSIGLLFILIAISACTVQNQTNNDAMNEQAKTDNTMEEKSADVMNGHIGCQEGEIKVDGTCAVAVDNNASLFGQDLDEFVVTSEINNEARGFLAKPIEAGNYPGVIMIHEWWGLNDNIREMAKLLAKEGYVVFAVDLYGVPAATESAEAAKLATAARANQKKAIADMQAAANYLRDTENVTQLASMGWCFGGQHSLLLSLNEPMDATIVYYGQLTDDKDELMNIAGPVLGIFGELDTSIPLDSVRSFESALNELNIKNDIYVYDGLGHAFANPSGSNYAANQTKDAWNKTVNFLSANLGQNSSGELITNEPSQIVFNLTGENYKFSKDGIDAPELRVNLGDNVRIELTSTEGFHDWAVDEFNVKTEQVNKGESTFVEFIADKTGTYEYYCSVGNHRAQGMVGILIVE